MNLDDHCEDYAAIQGNWRKFGSFAWHDPPTDENKWCIVYTHNRDSGTVDRCNAAVIAERLEAVPSFDDDARIEDHNHWAVGWVKGYAIRVRDAAGNITPTFRVWVEIQIELANYPSLDDERLSKIEFEEACDAWAQMSVRGRVEIWQGCGRKFHLMACRRDELPHEDSGRLEEMFRSE